MTNHKQRGAPELALWLGYCGLAPFAICAAAAHGNTPTIAAYGLIGAANYGAVILSFVGAIHWGLAMQDGRHVYSFSLSNPACQIHHSKVLKLATWDPYSYAGDP